MNIKESQFTLSIETATRSCSLAILRGAETAAPEICAVWTGENDFSASDNLLLEIQKLLQQAGIKLSQVTVLTAIIGPGSFTGLRVGVAIAKGLTAAGGIPLIGVPTLAALAFEGERKIPSCAILPGGRNEFFGQIFRSPNLINADLLQTGELEQVLENIRGEGDLRVVAPAETHDKITRFIKNEQIENWILDFPPKNLAVCAGQIACQELGQNKLSTISNQLIYGREAVVVRQK